MGEFRGGLTNADNEWEMTSELLPSCVAAFAANYALNVRDRDASAG